MKFLISVFLLGIFVAASLASKGCVAQESPASPSIITRASEMNFQNGIMATKPNDQRLYVLLGGGFLRPFIFGDVKSFVLDWLADHPNAVKTDISRMVTTNTITHAQLEIVYIWIEEGPSSLNVDLVRHGIVVGGAMYDMVDNRKGLDELLANDPRFADARAQIEKERAAAPQDRADRLIPENNYKARMSRIDDADQYARAKKLGIWSDAMKAEREAEGIQ